MNEGCFRYITLIAVPDSFNHGTSEQRSRWLKKGLRTGDIQQGDTFTPAYQAL